LVETLGKFPLPVEIVHFASSLTIKQIKELGCTPKVRQNNGKDYISDNGNLIIDCQFDQITDPAELSFKLLSIPGVVETGLFLNSMVAKVIVSDKMGNVREL
jgi:ribose 5-phosphate isomerase A